MEFFCREREQARKLGERWVSMERVKRGLRGRVLDPPLLEKEERFASEA
jgi:hypothetical protein